MCNNSDFVHLHTHDYGSIDAISSPLTLLTSAKNKGQKAMAITNHGSLSTIVEFSQAAKSLNMKPIAGLEAYLEVDNVTTHLTLWGSGLKGYNNLVRILNNGVKRAVLNEKNLQRHPINLQDLIDNNEGIWIATGCPASILQYKNSTLSEAEDIINLLKGSFDDRLFAEAMISSDDDGLMKNSLERALLLSETCKLPLVVTNDIHFAEKHQRPAHEFFVWRAMGFSYKDDDLYVKSRNELLDSMKGFSPREIALLETGLDNSVKIADLLEPIEFKAKPTLPFIEDSKEKFQEAVYSAMELHLVTCGRDSDYKQAVKDRVDYEIEVITNKGFDTYFLITKELVDVAHNRNLPISFRGSGAGSFASYLMGITNINPLDYNLLFERFINPERNSFPDFDLDFSANAREEIIRYAKDKYDAVPIVTNSYYSHKSLIRDMAKHFKLSDEERNDILDNEKSCSSWDKVVKRESEFSIVYETLVDKSIRHQGKHAGGIVILSEDSEYLIPTTIGKDGNILSSLSEGGHGTDLGSAGGVKIDLLGVSTLEMIEELQETTKAIPPELLPNQWDNCFSLIMKGEVDGAFQINGNSNRNYAMLFDPRSISDLSVVTAMARPAARDSGAASEYLKHRSKKGYPRVRSIPPENEGDLIDLKLENGYNVVVYSHWEIKTNDGKWIKICDLTGDEDIYIEE